MLHEGKTPEDMMQLALAGFEPNVLDERDVHYQCDCSAERTKDVYKRQPFGVAFLV